MTKKKTPPKNKRSTDTLADFEKALDALVQKANAAAKVPSLGDTINREQY